MLMCHSQYNIYIIYKRPQSKEAKDFIWHSGRRPKMLCFSITGLIWLSKANHGSMGIL